MGNGGLSQVTVSETVDAGVLVKADGEKAKPKNPYARKDVKNQEGKAKIR